MTSCHQEKKPNYRFFPNMYDGIGYETYQGADVFPNGMEAMSPVKGTIKRGWMPYTYSNTNEGYELAKKELKNPLEVTEAHLKKGKELYNIYCSVCHGKKGDGQGILVKREKFLGVPSYASRDLTQGSIYHVIYHGLNAMGSYAVQLDEKERWEV
ncbi:cytochrome C, partial [Elysia marginata]